MIQPPCPGCAKAARHSGDGYVCALHPYKMKPLVIFHKDCFDGTGAALAAYLKFGDEAEYLPCIFDDPIPVLTTDEKGRDVYILDFSFKRPVMEQWLKNSINIKFHIIDHHKTAKADLEGLDKLGVDLVFDMEHSGAVLAWKYFHGNEKMPDIFKFIEDRDLWKWEHKETAAINKGLWLLGFNDPKKWINLINEAESLQYTLKTGEACLAYEKRFFEFISQYAYSFEWEDHFWYAINFNSHQSEMGHMMAEKSGGAGLVWWWNGKTYIVSLRSLSNDDIDVSAIALKYGGGGHKHAAGFNCKELPFPPGLGVRDYTI